MGRAASRLHRQHGFDLVHCRSYVPCLIGEQMQRRFQLPLLFDMRGFWADERVDAGIWARDRWPYCWMYRFFKRKEREFLCRAEAVVTLTHSARREIYGWRLPAVGDKISVIPCCSDLRHFSQSQVDPERKSRLAGELGLEPEDFVVVYLGSIGTWYALDEMLAFFARLAQRNPRAKLLMITPDPSQQILARAQRLGLASDRLCFYHSPRSHVPTALALGKLALCFIKPFYSKIGSSPTKLGEYLSMGLPVVSNRVGDSDWLAQYQLGPLLNDFDEASYEQAIDQLPEFLSRSPESYRKVAEEYFSLESGIQSYLKCYHALVGCNAHGVSSN
jgi:glycosyltransferase involved in cell wall biosynthesis